MYKLCNVVMLSTNEKTPIIKGENVNYLVKWSGKGIPQHLYITSNDEIKEGSLFIANQGVHLCIGIDENDTQYPYITKNDKGDIIKHSRHWKTNVIATTDSSLWEHDATVPYPKTKPALPQIPQQFIEHYVSEYNKGRIITEVMIEFEGYKVNGMIDEATSYKLKLNQDNTINIKPVKDSWSREEVERIVERVFNHCISFGYNKNLNHTDWIKQNL